jgi:hypothetical protein
MLARRFFYVSLGILALSSSTVARVGAVVIDFENLPAMPVVAGAPIPAAARLSNQFLLSDGVAFRSGATYVAVVELGPNHATSGVNGIAGSTPDGRLWYEPIYPVAARFFYPADPSQLAVTDFVSLRGDLEGDSGGSVTLNAYDVAGNLIGSITVPDSGGQLLAISTPGIHRVEFLGTNNNYGVSVDDFTFNAVTPIVNAADETTWGRVKAIYR